MGVLTRLQPRKLLNEQAVSWSTGLRSHQTGRRLPVKCQASASAPVDTQPKLTQVRFKTLPTCELAVSIYPKFSYNASGGKASGSVQDLGNGQLALDFYASTISIPALNWKSTSFLMVPLPPPLEIAIVPSKLQGTMDMTTGRMDLEFAAQFKFSVGSLYSAPALEVVTTLTTESSSGKIHSSTGRRLSSDGQARLVGVARVPKVQDIFLDNFLMLPTDALAVLDAAFEFE